MCGRATIVNPAGIDETVYGFTKKFVPDDWTRPRYNIRPTDPIPVLRTMGDERELTMLRWWLIPRWAKEQGKLPTFNARADTIAEKPSFRESFRDRRCLILIDGFYEWPKKPEVGKATDKRPRLIRFVDRRPFALAGLWDRSYSSIGFPIESCTIITTEANPMLESVPHDRMPVILDPEAQARWQDAGTLEDELHALLAPRSIDDMELVVTSSEFVNYGIDDERCIAPVTTNA